MRMQCKFPNGKVRMIEFSHEPHTGDLVHIEMERSIDTFRVKTRDFRQTNLGSSSRHSPELALIVVLERYHVEREGQ